MTILAALLLSPLVPVTVLHAHAQVQNGGVELDAYGDISTFGSNSVDTSGAPHWTSDMARSIAVESDGSGGWVLDAFGGVHAFGAAPQPSGYTQWPGWDIARAIAMVPGSSEGYTLDGWGGVHAFGGAPQLSGYPYWKGDDIARGIDIHLNGSGVPDGGATLDDAGVLHPWGDFPYTAAPAPTYPGRDAFLALHHVGGALYAVGRYGVVVPESAGTSITPDYAGFKDWGDQDLLRDLVLFSAAGGSSTSPPVSYMAQQGWDGVIGPRGGATIDGFGGVHPFGGLQLNLTGLWYWPGWDIVRGLALLPDGSGGWTLDGFGGVHAFGEAVQPAVSTYWNGWDIARAVVMNPGGHTGYVLDGWGGIHPLGGAPALNGAPYWYGWDIARGLAIHYAADGTPDGGWTLDAWGAVHPFGAAPAVPQSTVWTGRDVYEQLHRTWNGGLYSVGRWGVVENVSVPAYRPYWNGYGDWGGWDIIRDVVLVGTDAPAAAAQPVSPAAVNAYWSTIWVYSFNIGPVTQGLPLDCESAALEEATIARGRDVSQYSIFDQLPKQPGSATWGADGIASWGDPYAAFVGNVYGSEARGTGYGVYDPAIAQVAQHFGFNAIGLEGASAFTIFTYLAMGDPVLVVTSDTFTPVATHWWTAWDGRSIPYSLTDHAVTLVGENGLAGTVTLNDVADGRMKTFTMAQFAAFWTAYLDMAVVLT